MKKILKLWVKNVLLVFGMISICTLLMLTLVPEGKLCMEHQLFLYNHIRRLMLCSLTVITIGTLFEVLTQTQKLFSQKLWVRRLIVVLFALALLIVCFSLFGIFSPYPPLVIALLIVYLVVFGLLSTWLCAVVIDRLHKKDVADINRRLTEIHEQDKQ